MTSTSAQSGITGSLTWKINNNTLTISGNGAMPDYLYAPWYPYRASIINVVMENGITYLGDYAFEKCESLISIIIPNSVTSMGQYAFSQCYSLPSITIPGSISVISAAAFYKCTGLTSVTILNGVQGIDPIAFSNCTSLTTLTLPESLKWIDLWAFDCCRSLTLITSLNPVPPIELNWRGVFTGVDVNSCTLQVPINSVSAYQNAGLWRYFNIVGINVGIDALESDIVKIYPNPTTGELQITNYEPQPREGQAQRSSLRINGIEVFDIMGRKVLFYYITATSYNHLINISHLNSGIYFVKIDTEEGMLTKKIVKL